MRSKKIEEKLNKNINEETELVNKISLVKYMFIYVPLLFLMFGVVNYLTSIFLESVVFDWKQVLFQSIFFSIFFRIFHYMRKGWNDGWKK